MRHIMNWAARAALVAVSAVLMGAAANTANADIRGYGRAGGNFVPPAASRTIIGEKVTLASGATAYTWARVNPHGFVQEVGVSIPRQLIWNPSTGSGPAGSFLVLDFPDVVKSTTFLNHIEVHWNPQGHPPEVFLKPHFDFHFYGIPEGAVWDIMPPDTVAPRMDMIPAGYFYPGVEQAVPQMGVHAIDPRDFSRPFNASMIIGYWNGNMTFIEPMITREYLMSHPNFGMAIPRPQYLYRATDYPASVQVHYNPRSLSYEFFFRGFSAIGTPPTTED